MQSLIHRKNKISNITDNQQYNTSVSRSSPSKYHKNRSLVIKGNLNRAVSPDKQYEDKIQSMNSCLKNKRFQTLLPPKTGVTDSSKNPSQKSRKISQAWIQFSVCQTPKKKSQSKRYYECINPRKGSYPIGSHDFHQKTLNPQRLNRPLFVMKEKIFDNHSNRFKKLPTTGNKRLEIKGNKFLHINQRNLTYNMMKQQKNLGAQFWGKINQGSNDNILSIQKFMISSFKNKQQRVYEYNFEDFISEKQYLDCQSPTYQPTRNDQTESQVQNQSYLKKVFS